jgi:hypothetical protein
VWYTVGARIGGVTSSTLNIPLPLSTVSNHLLLTSALCFAQET